MDTTYDANAYQYAEATFDEVEGHQTTRLQAAIWAYQWALDNQHEENGGSVYPPFDDLRAALKKNGWKLP